MFGKKRKQAASFESRVSSSEWTSSAPYTQPATRHSQLLRSRRGVLLLVVLSLLVLFMMIGTAFIVSTKQFEKGAKASQRAALQASDSASHADLLDEVLMQLVRDTNNPASSLRYHSLLEDLYGIDGWVSQIPPRSTSSQKTLVSDLIAPLTAGAAGLNPANVETAEYTVRWPDNGLPITDSNYRANVTGGQILEFDLVKFNNLYEESHEPHASGPPFPHAANEFSSLDDAYAGQVLTFTSGPARGQSTRIVGSFNRGNWLTLRVMAFKLADGTALPSTNAGLQQLLTRTHVLVNGRPFNGTGAGFNFDPSRQANYTGPRSDTMEGGAGLLALLPNTAFVGAAPGNGYPMENIPDEYFLTGSELTGLQNVYGGDPANYASVKAGVKSIIGWNGRGGGDESYDAPDFQNMALAMAPSVDVLQETTWPDVTAPVPGNLGTMVLPSFHRPELINFWMYGAAAPTPALPINPDMLRKVMLRPSWIDHPNFTGSNPEFEVVLQAFQANPADVTLQTNLINRMIYGPWDVDNDNDGVRDSVWVDIGAPVMVGPNGKLMKPMAAILCFDMDGRLNVNVHGSLDLAEIVGGADDEGRRVAPERADPSGLQAGPETDDTPRGTGYGPADVSLEMALGNNAPNRNFSWIMTGHTIGGVNYPGRYGFVDDTTSGAIRPGRMNQDVISQINFFGWPQWGNMRSNFGTPPDLRARYGTAVNDYGQPIFEATMATELDRFKSAGLLNDSPYEFDMSIEKSRGVIGVQGASAADAPFSPAELERALRIFDADARSLPERLSYLAGVEGPGGVSSGLSDRTKITTDSNDLPAPNVVIPAEMREMVAPGERQPQSVAELLETRVRFALQKKNNDANKYPLFPTKFTDPTAALEIRNAVRQLLSPEHAAGLRLDVNRPLGNGRDDTPPNTIGNGVVDEPGEFRDLNADKIFDPGEEQLVWDPAMASARDGSAKFGTAAFTPLDADGDGRITQADSMLQRQLLARHLYVTALMTSAGPDYGIQTGGTYADKDIKLARRLAQWAINSVDFRDSDAIMSEFEYDINPFDGWDVDGWIGMKKPGGSGTTSDPFWKFGEPFNANVDDTNPIENNKAAHRGVVWGAERPELLITETLAWHDRRTEDEANEEVDAEDGPETEPGTTEDEDPASKDTSYDQVRRPRGAFFAELYNPWPTNPAASGDTHDIFTAPGKDLGVNLSAFVPDPTNPSTGSPVWRLAVYRTRSVAAGAHLTEQGAFIDPDDPEADPATPNDNDHPVPTLDRTAYFTGFDPNFGTFDGEAFYNDSANAPVLSVRPGRYMVVGSGEDRDGDGVYEAPLGDPNIPNSDDMTSAELRDEIRRKQRRFELRATQTNEAPVRFVKGDTPDARYPQAGVPNDPTPIDGRRSMTDVAVLDQPRRFTISEPPRGYPNSMAAYGFGSVWQESTDRREGAEGRYVHNENRTALPIDMPLDDNLDIRTDLTERLTLGSHPNFRQVCLQRLANPLMAWNPEPSKVGAPTSNGHNPDLPVNPYITVDSSSSNLTVFNGRNEGEESAGDANNPLDPVNVTVRPPNNGTLAYFGSVERGWSYDLRDASKNAGDQANVWAPEDIGRRMTGKVRDAGTSQYFRPVPECTLGYLNKSFDAGDNAFNNDVGMRRPTIAAGAGPNPPSRPQPFPWLTWNDRPFVSGNELMNVPAWRSSQMLRQFSMRIDDELAGQAPPGTTIPKSPSPYEEPVVEKYGARVPAAGAGAQPVPQFSHLENFLYRDNSPPDGVPNALYRVLDLIHTPSLFAGTQEWLNPAQFGNSVVPVTTTVDARLNRQPPFNSLSEYREPGRINLNTIPGKEIWDGLFHGSAKRDGSGGESVHAGPDDDEFADSRRGYSAAGATTLDPKFPTMFANPFRPDEAAALVPLTDMQVLADRRQAGGVGSSILRRHPTATTEPLFSATTTLSYNDSRRNAYFHYAPMSRTANLVTTRSNVYAVWITIGFFEVDELTDDPNDNVSKAIIERFTGQPNSKLDKARENPMFAKVYPDGYTLGRELGAEEGDVQRLRGFYILDRSIPAGFEPGKNVNVENVIRLKRKIE